MGTFDRRFDRRDFGNGVFFGLPLTFEQLEFLAFLAQLGFERVALAGGLDCRQGQADFVHARGDFLPRFGDGVEFHAHASGRFVEKIDRLVGQMPRRQITPRLVDRRHYGLVRNGNPVMDFVDLLDAAQH